MMEDKPVFCKDCKWHGTEKRDAHHWATDKPAKKNVDICMRVRLNNEYNLVSGEALQPEYMECAIERTVLRSELACGSAGHYFEEKEE